MPVTDVTISSLSTQFIQVPVQATQDGLPYDPTGDNVFMAFMQSGVNPGNTDWNVGNWSASSTGMYLAQCLVGPLNSGVVLASGYYVVWVKIQDSPEVPVVPAGTMTVT